mgnify:CR=1 FL=1
MFEAVRLNKHILTHEDGTPFNNIAFMFLYVGNKFADYKTIESNVIQCMQQIKEKKIWDFLTNWYLL